MNGHNDYTPPADHIVDLWQDNDVSRMLLHLVVLWKEGGGGDESIRQYQIRELKSELAIDHAFERTHGTPFG